MNLTEDRLEKLGLEKGKRDQFLHIIKQARQADASRENDEAMELLISAVIVGFFLIGWSCAVGFICAQVAQADWSSLIFLIVLFTHGGAEIFITRMVTVTLISAAEKLVQAPELSQNLDSMTATWHSRGLSRVMPLGCALLGLVVTLILLAGAWHPALAAFSWIRAVIGVLLTLLWGYVGWTWFSTQRTIRHTMARVTITSTFDRLTVEQRGVRFKRDIELLISGLTVRAGDTHLHLHSGEQVVSVYCAPGPERKKLIDTIQQRVDQANADPFSQPELPQVLAEDKALAVQQRVDQANADPLSQPELAAMPGQEDKPSLGGKNPLMNLPYV